MLRNLFMLLAIASSFSLIDDAKAVHDVFVCKCVAKAPGVDNVAGEKLCSYDCNCTGYNKDQAPKENIKVSVLDTPTSARSKDQWDFGSSICHGQYAYKSNLSDPNWKIKVKFSPFTVNSYNNGQVSYAEQDQMVEVAIGVKYYLKRSTEALEIVQSLRNQL